MLTLQDMLTQLKIAEVERDCLLLELKELVAKWRKLSIDVDEDMVRDCADELNSVIQKAYFRKGNRYAN